MSSTSHLWQKDVDIRNRQEHTFHDNSNRSLEISTSDKPQCGPRCQYTAVCGRSVAQSSLHDDDPVYACPVVDPVACFS